MPAEAATGTDLDTLLALNHDYIESVQHGDVQRFDELLADDFLASNPDGFLVDKHQFLEQTARPVTISGLEALDVRVRILGDVALIHARTSYVTPAGEQRFGRYTDVWARREGRGEPSRPTLRADPTPPAVVVNLTFVVSFDHVFLDSYISIR